MFACEDTVYPDPMKEPVKMAIPTEDKSYLDENIFLMSDGTITINEIEFDEEVNRYTAIKKIERDGSITRYDTIYEFPLDNNYRINEACSRTNSVGEFITVSVVRTNDYDFVYSVIHKFDSKGKKIEKCYFDEPIQPELATLLDNGQIVYFTRDFIEGTGETNLVMHTIGNSFAYTMESNFECSQDENYTGIVSFEDKIVLYNQINDKYCIFRTDGSLVCENSIDIYLSSIVYTDGYLYMLSYTEGDDYDEDFDYWDENYIPHLWHITKMDTLGNQIFDNTINTYQLHNKLTVHGDSLIIIGEVITDYHYDKLEGNSEIHIFDNNNGKHIETISMAYENSMASPIYISPDSKGEYDVYLCRLDRYATQLFSNSVLFMDEGAICIYHTDDLRKLQVNK